LSELAQLRVVQCHTEAAIARRRVGDRAPSRRAHADATVLDHAAYFDDFVRVSIEVPSIDVDTTDGYDPSIDRLVDFVTGTG
jgi:hypothetical protein